ncbi:MAG: hypothetical protein QNJ41_10250 [Xenococcaceae cyanobacterium MO_188.B32]|nr:hypothetical protein [Xenococcaceae cyanobacterium MO_188.B32]
MRIQSYNTSIPINKTISTLLIWYGIAILFTYPYGIEVIGDNYIRLPDLIAIAMAGLVGLHWFLLGKSKLKLQPLFPLLPFLCLELIFPIIGAIYYGPISVFLSSGRVLLLYLPITICVIRLSTKSALKLDTKIEKLLKIAVITNLFYSIIQLAVNMRILPEFLLITNSLEVFAADEHFNQLSGLRISGFFVNVSALATFGIVAMSYFLAKFQVKSKENHLLYVMIALLLVLLSTSRSAYVVALILIIFSLITSKLKKSLKIALTIILSFLFLALLLSLYLEIDYEVFFSRFIRIQEEGLQQDYSWSTRVQGLWPIILYRLRAYPWGTLVPSFKVLGIIDSGYLTYYAQGKWIFIAGLFSSFILILTASFRVKKSHKNWSVFFLRYLLVYLLFSMVVTNPMRSPTVIFALLYGLWFLSLAQNRYLRNNISSHLFYKYNNLSETGVK